MAQESRIEPVLLDIQHHGTPEVERRHHDRVVQRAAADLAEEMLVVARRNIRSATEMDDAVKRSPPLPNPLPRGGGEGTGRRRQALFDVDAREDGVAVAFGVDTAAGAVSAI